MFVRGVKRLYNIDKRFGWPAYRYIKEELPHFIEIDPRLAIGNDLRWWEEELSILMLKGYREMGFELLPIIIPEMWQTPAGKGLDSMN